MIIITGATGQLGSQVVDRLLERVPPSEIGVSVRDVDRAGALAAAGVRVRHGDFTDPASLTHAFDGATQVLIVSTNEHGDDAVSQHRSAIDAACTAGAERIVYTSHQGANAASRFAPMPDHATTEQHLAATGTQWTSLRNGFYASTVPHLIGDAVDSGELVAPADGPVSWTTHADLAEAAAVVLTEPHRFDGATPPLTASDTLDLAATAQLLSEITGRTIRRVVVDDDEYVATMIANGTPAPVATLFLGLFHASRAGEFDHADPALEKILLHPPTPLSAVLRATLGR